MTATRVLVGSWEERKGQTWKDKHVVALRRRVRLAVQLNRVEGRATRKDGTALRPAVHLLRARFALRRRVREREDDRPLVVIRHRSDNLFRE